MYRMHFTADFTKNGCTTRRELMRSTFVDVGVDPQASNLQITPVAGGMRVELCPQDRCGNPSGWGRRITCGPTPECDCEPQDIVDHGDGCYTIHVRTTPNTASCVVEGLGKPFAVRVATFASFTGKAHGVGIGKNRAGVAIVGIFTSTEDIDLSASAATVTITSLFDEVGGAGERVSDLPLTLFADPRNNANVAIFKTPVGRLPIAKVTIGALSGGRFTLRVDVAKATIVPPSLCPTTDLRTSLTISPFVVVTTEQPWLCFGTGNRYLKSPPP
jgi:hypothetical protein